MNDDEDASAKRHRGMLYLSCAVIVLSFCFIVRPDDRLAVRGLPDWPLPATCLSRSLFGVNCPGCGLTRSFVHLAHGDWRASLGSHRVGWVLAAAVLVQIPYRLSALRRRRERPWGPWFARLGSTMLIAMLLGNWLLQQFGV